MPEGTITYDGLMTNRVGHNELEVLTSAGVRSQLYQAGYFADTFRGLTFGETDPEHRAALAKTRDLMVSRAEHDVTGYVAVNNLP